MLPYLLHKHLGKEVWSLAAGELFKGRIGQYLLAMGTVSTQDPDRDRIIVNTPARRHPPLDHLPGGGDDQGQEGRRPARGIQGLQPGQTPATAHGRGGAGPSCGVLPDAAGTSGARRGAAGTTGGDPPAFRSRDPGRGTRQAYGYCAGQRDLLPHPRGRQHHPACCAAGDESRLEQAIA